MKARIVIVTPVFNDWQSFQILVDELNKLQATSHFSLERIIAVNDGSSEHFNEVEISSEIPITVLNLNNNMGHQRAISIGLCYVEDQVKNIDHVVVMDCDGEDRPVDIKKIVNHRSDNDHAKIIFAKRAKRSEGFTFKFFYHIYKFVFYALTSQRLDFGNFSCIPKKLLAKLVSIPELWNHYSGGIIKSKLPYASVGTDRGKRYSGTSKMNFQNLELPYASVGTDRGKRYSGTSKMNFQNLVLHGLSSISIYLDIVSIRLLIAAFLCALLTIIGLAVVIFIALFTDIPIPGWSSIVVLSLINILAIVLLTTFLILLFQLNQKNTVKYPPKKFYKDFILSVSEL
jgi:hypothetical protein